MAVIARAAGTATVVALLAALALGGPTVVKPVAAQAPTATYFPDRGNWERRAPAEVGMDAAALEDAVAFSVAHENQSPRDPVLKHAQTFAATEPFDALIGPVKERGPLSGIVIRRGYLVADWGEPNRVDMTHSVTKTFLSTVVGLAWEKGLIRNLGDRARDYMPPGVDVFDAPHNQSITWEHLLRQTSDWQGTLWGKPDWADRPVGTPKEWANRPLYEPGTHFKYNDVRVNVLALAALHVIRRPLPDVLRAEVMEPIGASSTWRWHGYENSWIQLDGQNIQSVSGGGHWGGGMFINAWDMARFGYLFLRGGRWKDRQIVPPKWIEMARTPGPANADYGFMNWYLNTTKKPLPSVPESSVRFVGNGQNIVYIDWQNDLVIVVRWFADDNRALDQFFAKVIAAIK